MLFESFDRIRIINLPHRTDRRAEMLGELVRVGLARDPRVQFSDASSFADRSHFYSAGARGCFASHMAILEVAVAARHSVLILEDDCDFTSHTQRFRLPERWDIFYGGVASATDPSRLATSDLVGSHFMGFHADVLERLVAWLQAAFHGDDPAPIDGEYVRFRRAHPDVVTVFAEPPVGVQRPSRTDIGDLRAFDRVTGIRSAVALARKVKRIVRRLGT